jgi:hypothetical protein
MNIGSILRTESDNFMMTAVYITNWMTHIRSFSRRSITGPNVIFLVSASLEENFCFMDQLD